MGSEGDDNYVPAFEGCGAVRYENHNTDGDEVKVGETVIGHKCTCDFSAVVTPTVTEGNGGDSNCADGKHTWVVKADADGDGPATCEAPGQKTYVCAKAEDGCTATKVEALPPTGHSLTPAGSVAATCNTDGKTLFKCTNTGCTLDGSTEQKSVVKPIPATGNHTWKQTSVTPATCAAEGHYTYTCTVCSTEDTSKTIAIDPNAHVWGDPAKDAAEGATTHTVTCTVDGCGGEDGEAATKTVACTYSIVVTEGDGAYLAPTCTVAGHKATQKCACGREQAGAAIPATGHRANSAWVKTDAAGHYHTCKTCDAQIEEEKVAHTGENSCTVCGWTKGGSGTPEQPGDTHQHTQGSTVKYDANQHWYICDGGKDGCDAQKYAAANHSWGSNATSANGKCTGCDQTHTCDTAGTDNACSKCGYKAPDQGTPG